MRHGDIAVGPRRWRHGHAAWRCGRRQIADRNRARLGIAGVAHAVFGTHLGIIGRVIVLVRKCVAGTRTADRLHERSRPVQLHIISCRTGHCAPGYGNVGLRSVFRPGNAGLCRCIGRRIVGDDQLGAVGRGRPFSRGEPFVARLMFIWDFHDDLAQDAAVAVPFLHFCRHVPAVGTDVFDHGTGKMRGGKRRLCVPGYGGNGKVGGHLMQPYRRSRVAHIFFITGQRCAGDLLVCTNGGNQAGEVKINAQPVAVGHTAHLQTGFRMIILPPAGLIGHVRVGNVACATVGDRRIQRDRVHPVAAGQPVPIRRQRIQIPAVRQLLYCNADLIGEVAIHIGRVVHHRQR